MLENREFVSIHFFKMCPKCKQFQKTFVLANKMSRAKVGRIIISNFVNSCLYFVLDMFLKSQIF